MNLIEQLGGYEKAKEYLVELQRIPMHEQTEDTISYLPNALLDYRRKHNIFEVGDKVVDTNYKDSDVQEIKSINGNRVNVFHKNKSYYFSTFVFSFRHATDEEIKAGKRLEILNESDRIIASYDLVESYGGLEKAKLRCYPAKHLTMESYHRLKQAISDVESCK